MTFRYQDSKTKRSLTRTVSGAHFLWLIVQHVLPSRFRRALDYGFLHPNSKTLIKIIHLLFTFDPTKWLPKVKPRPQMLCARCGAGMRVIQVQIKENVQDLKMLPKNPEDPLGIEALLAM